MAQSNDIIQSNDIASTIVKSGKDMNFIDSSVFDMDLSGIILNFALL